MCLSIKTRERERERVKASQFVGVRILKLPRVTAHTVVLRDDRRRDSRTQVYSLGLTRVFLSKTNDREVYFTVKYHSQ